MTTTSTYQGMETIEKPTSRVINPPGGQSNFSLGWDGSEQNGDQQPQAEQTQPQQAGAEEATAEKVEPENPDSGNLDQNIPKPETNTAENAEPSNQAEINVATPQNESPPEQTPTDEKAETQTEEKVATPESESPPEQKPTEEKPESPKEEKVKSPKKSPTTKSAPKSPTPKSPPKSPRGKAPPPKSPRAASPPKTPREKPAAPANGTAEPKTPRAKASTPRSPRVKVPTPTPSQTPRASTPRKNDAREPKPDMVFGAMVIETRPGSGKKHFEKREVDTKGNLFGGKAQPHSDLKPGGNRRNVSTLYMGGDVVVEDDTDDKPTRRQYPTRESNSFAAVYCREGGKDTGAGNINPITGAPDSHKKHVKQQEVGNPIVPSSPDTTTSDAGARRSRPDRLKPEDLPPAGVKAYEEGAVKPGRIPPGGKSGGIF